MRYQLTILLINIILTQVLSTAHSDGTLKTSGYPEKGLDETNVSESFNGTDSDGNKNKNSSVSEAKKVIRRCCRNSNYLMNKNTECLKMSESINDTEWKANLTAWEGIKEFNLSGVELNNSGLTCPENGTTKSTVYPNSEQYRLVSNGSLEIMTPKGPVYYDSDHYCLNNYKDDSTSKPIINAVICSQIIRICCKYLMNQSECVNTSEIINANILRTRLTKWNGSKEFNLALVRFHTGCKPECAKDVPVTMVHPNRETYRLMSNGDLEIKTESGGLIYLDTEHYCLTNYIDKKTPEPMINAGICNNLEPDPTNYELNAYFMLVSCVFILLTVGVYLSLPHLYIKRGNKMLIAYLLSFFVTFLSLAILTLDRTQYKLSTCNVITFVVYFSMLSAFFWTNAMCYDFWNRFKHPFIVNTMSRNKSSSRFYWYCAYAFGAPTVLSAFLAVCEYTDIPVPIKPRLDIQKCFFDGRVKQVYLYIPILILCIANIIMFVLTAVNIEAQKRGVKNSNESRVHNRSEERRFWMYIKLFTMMGITWIFEVIGSFFPGAYALWQFIDAYNLLVGPIIFLMFACKKKIWNQLRDRFTWKKWFTNFSTEATLSSSLKMQSTSSGGKEDATNSTKNKDVELPVLNGNQNMNGTHNHMLGSIYHRPHTP